MYSCFTHAHIKAYRFYIASIHILKYKLNQTYIKMRGIERGRRVHSHSCLIIYTHNYVIHVHYTLNYTTHINKSMNT